MILDEEHPLAGCMEVQHGAIKIIDDYFGRKPDIHQGWTHFSGADDAVETKYQFSWPLGDVITSLAQAGLRIELFDERPSRAEWRFGNKLDEVARLPGAYLLVARNDGNGSPSETPHIKCSLLTFTHMIAMLFVHVI